MQTKLKGLWEKVKGFFLKLNKKVRILLGVAAAALLILIIAAAILLNRKEYALLYTGLNANETSTIVNYLYTNGVDYQVQGDAIYVPKGRETQLQAQLAMSGYPSTGFLYEYYTENSGGLTTTLQQDRAFLIATQTRLEAIISLMDGVQSANVQITPGTERVYVLDPDATPATAVVRLTPDGTQQVSSQVAAAIRLVVARSVAGLDVTNVEVLDIYGNTYSGSDSVLSEMSQINAMKLQYEEEINNKIRMAVLQNLEPVYGPGNIQVSVNSTVDMNRKVVETTEYSQPEGSMENGGLIGTEKWFWEVITDGDTAVGGVPGTTTNSDISIYPDGYETLTGEENLATASGEIDSKLNSSVQQMEVLAGTITDIGVAVTINQDSPNSGSQSVDDLRKHVAVIANVGTEDPASRVSVMIAPFYTSVGESGSGEGTLIPGVDNWIVLAALGGLLLFIVLLIVILLVRGKRKKKRLAQQKALEEEMLAAEAAEAAAIEAAAAVAAAAPTGGADIMEVNTEKSMELRKTVRQFAQNNPEIAAQMVKAWLKGEESSASSS